MVAALLAVPAGRAGCRSVRARCPSCRARTTASAPRRSAARRPPTESLGVPSRRREPGRQERLHGRQRRCSVSEFARHADGSLSELPSPNNCIAQTSSTDQLRQCDRERDRLSRRRSRSAPTARTSTSSGRLESVIGAIAEFARNADGSLTQLTGANNCIGENSVQTGGTRPSCAPAPVTGSTTRPRWWSARTATTSTSPTEPGTRSPSSARRERVAQPARRRRRLPPGARRHRRPRSRLHPSPPTACHGARAWRSAPMATTSTWAAPRHDRRVRAQRGRIPDAAQRREQLHRGARRHRLQYRDGRRPPSIVSLDVSPDGHNSTAPPATTPVRWPSSPERRRLPDPARRPERLHRGEPHRRRHRSPAEGCGTKTGPRPRRGRHARGQPGRGERLRGGGIRRLQPPCHGAVAEF